MFSKILCRRIAWSLCVACFGLTLLSAQKAADLKGLKFRSIGPAAMSGRITAITCDPFNSNIIYAGAASGGVWRSQGGGTKWEPIFDKAPIQNIGSIAISPNNPDEIWVGTGEGNPRNSQNFGAGIFKSIDGGKNWVCMGLEKTKTIHRILIDKHNPLVVWAASLGAATGPNEERGVFKTTDGGKTWRKVLYVNDLTGCADLVLDPRNPNKLVAAMWEYRRWPWFFKSGGKGSGLHISYDGGETWTRSTEKDGLPEGELGRIGLAIAPSNPDVLYALVEAKDNALYKSNDGGRKWQKMADKNQGDRPFYYAELYVDPQNENLIYSIHSVITRSIDGGRTFDNYIGYWKIHPDHHAFWMNPADGKQMIDGNDGGLNMTYDGGKTWRYAENIPVGQFYHVNVDDAIPYNVYGGLQDNGSWVGPSSVWKYGGLRNSEWQEVYFGDGFDVMPQKDDPRYVYAMSQGGNLALIDRQSGLSREIRPMHPDDVKVRWNWNSALAQDPFRDQGIYYCSQFVHYSPDRGDTWTILSPDLTTNDTSKMHQDKSGGLTLDATNAENHCTIITVAPSGVKQGVVWIGTDDGNVQVTQDGGKTWNNCTARMPGCPKNAWIAQIEVSAKNAGEAFVVVNHYRMNDFAPYLYHTTDFGTTWKRLAGPDQVNSYCLSVVQDLQEPRLLFLGTDQGLYYSLDYGTKWTHWDNESLPSMPVQDMKIQAREGDLVLGTFGRAFWVLNNLAPLRALAKSGAAVLEPSFKLFQPQDAYLANFSSYDGPRFVGDETYIGENLAPTARIPVWSKAPKKADSKAADAKKAVEDPKGKDKAKGKTTATPKEKDPVVATDKPDPKDASKGDPKKDEPKKDAAKKEDTKKEKATVFVISMAGDTIRRFKTDVDTGFAVINWPLNTKGVRLPSNSEPDKEQLEPGNGPSALPGTYKVVVKLRDQVDSTTVRVLNDPRVLIGDADWRAKTDAYRSFYKTIERSEKAYQRLKDAEKTIKLIEDQWVNVPDSLKKDPIKLGGALRDSIGVLKELFFTQKPPKGILRTDDKLNDLFYVALGYIGDSKGAPSQNAQIAMSVAERASERTVARINALFDKQWKEYKVSAESVKYSLFKE